MALAESVGEVLEKARARGFKDLNADDRLLVFGDPKLELDLTPWVAFSELCALPWFSRGWIVQELLLPLQDVPLPHGPMSLKEREKSVYCGRNTASWSRFAILRSAVTGYGWGAEQRKQFPGFANENKDTHQQLDALPEGQFGQNLGLGLLEISRPDSTPVAYQRRHISIRNLVFEYRSQQVTDPQDKIYAFLGIATDIPKEIGADYHVSEVVAYTKFAKSLLTRNEPKELPLKLLSACYPMSRKYQQAEIRPKLEARELLMKTGTSKPKLVQDFDERLKIPSWVPDWTVEWRHRLTSMFEDILDLQYSFTLRMDWEKSFT